MADPDWLHENMIRDRRRLAPGHWSNSDIDCLLHCIDALRSPKGQIGEPFPDCMMPDGAEPCKGYLREYADRMKADQRLSRIAGMIEVVDNRCMAADGPVTPTLQEMTQAEISMIYKLAAGKPVGSK